MLTKKAVHFFEAFYEKTLLMRLLRAVRRPSLLFKFKGLLNFFLIAVAVHEEPENRPVST
jgi:hypothetical protein